MYSLSKATESIQEFYRLASSWFSQKKKLTEGSMSTKKYNDTLLPVSEERAFFFCGAASEVINLVDVADDSL